MAALPSSSSSSSSSPLLSLLPNSNSNSNTNTNAIGTTTLTALTSTSTSTSEVSNTHTTTSSTPPAAPNNSVAVSPKITSLLPDSSVVVALPPRSQLAITNIITNPKEVGLTSVKNDLQIITTQPPRKFEGSATEGDQSITPTLTAITSPTQSSNVTNTNISLKERIQSYPSSVIQNYPSLAQPESLNFPHPHSHHPHLYHPYFHPSHGIGTHHPERSRKDESETNTSNGIPTISTPATASSTTTASTTSHRITEILKGENISEISSQFNRAHSHQELSNAPMITDRSEHSDSDSDDGGVESPNNENAVATTTSGSNLNIVPSPKSGQTYVDITEYLNCAQSEAAKKLGIPTSTLSKRWKEAVRGRKWPFRTVAKLDKEIMTLLHNIPQGPSAPPLPEDVEQLLSQLLRRRQEELKPVVIRI